MPKPPKAQLVEAQRRIAALEAQLEAETKKSCDLREALSYAPQADLSLCLSADGKEIIINVPRTRQGLHGYELTAPATPAGLSTVLRILQSRRLQAKAGAAHSFGTPAAPTQAQLDAWLASGRKPTRLDERGRVQLQLNEAEL